jgi:hypothetical protein
MDLTKHSTLPRPSAPAQTEDTAARDKAVTASRGQAAETAMNDQSSYEAAISEGWPVPPPWQHARRLALE